MRVSLLGTRHELQENLFRLAAHDKWGGLERQQKAAYRALVDETIARGSVGLIAEEELPGKALYAASVGVGHALVDMPLDERARVGIPRNYSRDPGVPQTEKERFHRLRERYMFERCLASGGVSEAVLVICGSEHVAGLEQLFGDAGHEIVEVRDVCERIGFGETWLELELRARLT